MTGPEFSLSAVFSALASPARLVINKFRIAPRTLNSGRIFMVAFTDGGALLAPEIAFFTGRAVPMWSCLAAWSVAMAGAAAYLYRDSELVVALMAPLPVSHKYDQLPNICTAARFAGYLAGPMELSRKSKLAGRA